MLVIYYDFLYFCFTIIIIILIVLSSRSIYRKEFLNLKTKYLNYDDLETGDLLFLHYDMRYFLTGLYSPRFQHVCICSREGSNLFVYEYTNYFFKYYGFLKIPFSEWLKYNKKCTIGVNKLKIEGNSIEKRLELGNKFNNFRLKNKSYNFLNPIKFIKKSIYTNQTEFKKLEKTDDIVCYEIILHMLKDVQIISDIKHNINNMRADDLVYMNKFDLNSEYSYNEFYLANINNLKFICD